MKVAWGISKKWLSGILTGVCLVAIVSACMNDDADAITDVPIAFVSLYHGSPNAPDLDIEVDNRQINAYPFEYTDYTGYLRFYTGQRNLKFGPYSASNIVIDSTVTLEANKAYSIFVVDEYNQAGIVLLNDNAPTPASGMAKFRVINLSPDAPEVELAEQGKTTALAEALAFKEASDFMDIDAKEFDLQVRASANPDEILLNLPDINLQPGYYYTIIIRGYATPPEGNTNVLSAQIEVN
jgi:hypothetical protein